MKRAKRITGEPVKTGVRYDLSFGSVAALAMHLEAVPRVAGANDNSETNSASFAGTATLAEAVGLAVNGWQDGADKAGKALAARKRGAGERVRSSRQRARYDVSGDEVDVGRYLGGDVECMIERRRGSVKGKTVRAVNLSVCFGNMCSADALMRYAVAACAAVQRMEAGGVRVELWARLVARDADTENTLRIAVKVKGADSRLHPGALAFACGHPSFFRRIIFGAIERHPQMHGLSWKRYGKCAADTDTGYLTTATRFIGDSEVEAAIAEMSKAV